MVHTYRVIEKQLVPAREIESLNGGLTSQRSVISCLSHEWLSPWRGRFEVYADAFGDKTALGSGDVVNRPADQAPGHQYISCRGPGHNGPDRQVDRFVALFFDSEEIIFLAFERECARGSALGAVRRPDSRPSRAGRAGYVLGGPVRYHPAGCQGSQRQKQKQNFHLSPLLGRIRYQHVRVKVIHGRCRVNAKQKATAGPFGVGANRHVMRGRKRAPDACPSVRTFHMYGFFQAAVCIRSPFPLGIRNTRGSDDRRRRPKAMKVILNPVTGFRLR